MRLRIFSMLVIMALLWLAPSVLHGQAVTTSVVDVSQPFTYTNNLGNQVTLPAITTNSTPSAITSKFQGLINYFTQTGICAEIDIPAGTWLINQTLYLNNFESSHGGYQQGLINLRGAGEGTTMLQPAPGYEDMPVLMGGKYLQAGTTAGDTTLDLNALHHPQITGVYDGSVTGTHYGLRTLSTPSGTVNNRGTWATGTSYNVGDQVTQSTGGSTESFVCTTAHTSTLNGVNLSIASTSRTGNTVTVTTSAAHGLTVGTRYEARVTGVIGTYGDMNTVMDMLVSGVPSNTQFTYTLPGQDTTGTGGNAYIYDPAEPVYGTQWRSYWRETAVPASGLFFGTPLDAGPLDSSTNNTQPTFWKDTGQLTLDLCVVNNGTSNLGGQLLALTDEFSINLGGGIKLYVSKPGPDANTPYQFMCGTNNANLTLAPGVHRITLQFDYVTNHSIAIYVDGVQQPMWWCDINNNYNTGATAALTPDMASFMRYDGIGGGLALNNVSDITICGLNMSNTLRYAEGAAYSTQVLTNQSAPTDSFRYFNDDANTIAYLPLTDAPPADADYNNPAWSLVKVQEGQASIPSGGTQLYSYGWWMQQPYDFYKYGLFVNNLTINKPNSSYGACITYDNGYAMNLTNVALQGGFNAFDSINITGNNAYVFCFRNSTFTNASNAGIMFRGQNMLLGSNNSFPVIGRRAIVQGEEGNTDFTNTTFGPTYNYTDYLVFDGAGTSHGGFYNGVTIQPDPNHLHPSEALFHFGRADRFVSGWNALSVQNCTALNLPPNIVFFDLFSVDGKINTMPSNFVANQVNFSVANSGKLASFVKHTTPITTVSSPAAPMRRTSMSPPGWIPAVCRPGPRRLIRPPGAPMP